MLDLFIKVPEDVKFIIDTLSHRGYEAYIVGGCVRDSILGRKINDWDMTTSAKPEEIIELFDKVILTGVKHGTVTIVLNGNQYEVTTYRNDGEYDDNRHPVKVEFVSDLKEDLARRDFTINAMAYNNFNGLQDYFGSVDDLNNKIIKTVGNAEQRFNEDALRMMRAVRFSAQLNFDIDIDTLNGIKKVSANLKSISKERIREEFNKILLSDPDKIKVLDDTKLLDYIIPELKNGEHASVLRAKEVKEVIHLRLAAILRDLDDAEASKILKTLKYDNDTIKKVINLIKYADVQLKDKTSIKKILNIIGIDLTYDLIELKKAVVINSDEDKKIEQLNELDEVRLNISSILEKNECYSLKQLNITGNDLIESGFSKGKKIGIILNKLLDDVIENPKLNSRDKLMEIAYKVKIDEVKGE